MRQKPKEKQLASSSDLVRMRWEMGSSLLQLLNSNIQIFSAPVNYLTFRRDSINNIINCLMTQLQSIANCFRIDLNDPFPKTQPTPIQKENHYSKKSKNLSSRHQQNDHPHTHKTTSLNTRQPSTQLDSLDQLKDDTHKPNFKKNEAKSSLQVEGRRQQEGISVQALSKAHLVREIESQISLLESKSKQPGIKTHDLQSLGYQIYDKIDQYYINYGIYNNQYKFSSHFQTSLLNKFSSHKPEEEAGRTKKSVQRNSSALSVTSNLQDEEGYQSRKVFKTTDNLDISVSSISQTQQNEEDMPVFQTKMTESQLAGLDKGSNSQLDAEKQGQSMNQTYLQLKENIRVMEERIAFLIHRLEQTKTEVNELKEENSELQSKLKKQANRNKELKSQHQFLCLVHQKNLQQIERLQKIIQNLKNKQKQLMEYGAAFQKQINQQKQQIDCYKSDLAQKQSKINKLEAVIKFKTQQNAQLALIYRGFEEQEEMRKMELVMKLQESENEKARLKQTIKQYKNRIQTQGLSFKFQQAHRLKQLFEDSSAFHEKQIKKIEEQYSKIVQSLKQQLQQSNSSRRQLQNALIQSLGLKRLTVPEQTELTFSNSNCGKTAFCSTFANIKSEQLSKEFISFVQKCKTAEIQVKNQKQLITKYEDRIQILKEECQERFMETKELSSKITKKNEQIQELNKEIQQLKRYLRQNISSNINKRKKAEAKDGVPSVRRSKIQSKIIEINVAKQSVSDQSQLTLQSFIKKKVLDTPRNIIKFVLKLINFSQELQTTHKRKLPSLAPHSVLLSVKKLQDLQIVFSIISKKEEEQGLIYQAPQILLGFAESGYSHCWTIGVILDEMLNGRKFFKSFPDILSHKDNYSIIDDSFKNIDVLNDMIRKNHKQRISLQQAKRSLQVVYQSYR